MPAAINRAFAAVWSRAGGPVPADVVDEIVASRGALKRTTPIRLPQ